MDKKKIQQIEEVSKQAEKEAQQENILDILLDEDNKDPIVLIDNTGRRLTFEQIAVIPYNEKIYCVLKPVDKIENVQDDEAIVFFVDEQEGKEPVLIKKNDEKTAINVFDEYYNLLDEEDKKRKKKTEKK